MNVELLLKSFLISLSLLFGSCFTPSDSHIPTEDEIHGLQIRIEARVQEMREKTDAQWGDGFFDRLVSSEGVIEAFVLADDEQLQKLLEQAQADE